MEAPMILPIADVRKALVALTNIPGTWVEVNAILYQLRKKHPTLEKGQVTAQLATMHDLGQATLNRAHTGRARYDGIIIIDPANRLRGALIDEEGYAYSTVAFAFPNMRVEES